MLKLTYTESGFLIEYVAQSLEDWVTTRVLLSLRAGTSLLVEPSTASFLLPANLPCLQNLTKLQQEYKDILDIALCDNDYAEISLQGTWVATEEDSDEGIFVCAMSELAESYLERIWQEAQVSTSVLSE